MEHDFTTGIETFQAIKGLLDDDRIDMKTMIALSINNAVDLFNLEAGVAGYTTKIDYGILIKSYENHNLILPPCHL